VANIGAKTLTEITIDTDRERFELGRELDLVADPAYPVDYEGLDRADKPGPVCHRYTADSRFAYVTLGPGEAGGLVVVDLGGPDGQPFIHTAFPVGEVRANCGVALSADGRTMYASYGSPAPAEDGSDQGEWYAFDTATHTLRSTHDSRGADAHGVRVSPDGAELWMLNRASSSLIVVDTATDEVIAEMDDFGTSPDILDFSPDGSLLYVTLRGPNPRSGGSAVHPIAGETPGVAVIDVAARELLATVQPGRDLVDDQGRLRSDYHGIGVRHLPGDPGGTVTRLAGADRVGTALAVAQEAFGDGEADSAVLARAGDHPDALAGTPLAVVLGGPLLLTPTETLPSEVAAELTRLLPSGASVHVLGGPGAVSPEVAQAVTELGFSVQRLAGPTRFETAIAIAERLGDPPVQLITSGLDFADALSAGAAAAQLGGAVLLTTPEAPQAATEAYLAEHPAEERYAVGGPAARAHPEATAITGATRYETAVAVAERLFDESFVVGLARGEEFPDALAGGAHVAALGGPLLLTPGASLHPAVADYICARPSQLAGGFAYGGASVLTGEVLTTLADRLAGRGCTAARPVGAAPTRFAAAPGSDVGVCHLPTA
jgi:YVTN family beta-propeller protein